MKLAMSALVLCSLLSVSAETLGPNFKSGYDVCPSEIVPQWSGAVPGEWTFDYQNALSNAKAEGRYTLMLFSAMWWCPHCQPLEKNVLVTDAFRAYVQENGFYLTVLDFPYRDGVSNWCWLWDPDYRQAAGIGEWTPQDVSDELIARFAFQDSWTKGGAVTTNRNVLVEIGDGVTNLTDRVDIPRTVYHRVGYPTIIVVKPDGTEAGRFSFNKNIAPEAAVDYVIGNIDQTMLNAKSDLFENPTEGGLVGAAAATYDGWLTDGKGVVAGKVLLKTGKANKKTRAIKVSAAVTGTNGKKVTYSGTATVGTNQVVTLVKKNSSAVVSVVIGSEGFVGTFADATGSFDIQGARNVFSAKDSASKARASAVPKGVWPLALFTADDGGSAFARGTAGLSVSIASKGKVKVTGTLGDGTKVSVSSQTVVGENGVFAIPLVAPLYVKKGGFSATLAFVGGKMSAVTGISPWVAVKKPATFTAAFSDAPKFSAAPGGGSVGETLTLEIADFDEVAELNGCAVAINPNMSSVFVTGNKWSGMKGLTDLKVTYAPKTATFKGSLNVYCTDAKGKAKKVKGTLTGCVVNGIPYGTLVIKNVGSWAVTFSSGCGGDC